MIVIYVIIATVLSVVNKETKCSTFIPSGQYKWLFQRCKLKKNKLKQTNKQKTKAQAKFCFWKTHIHINKEKS